MTDRFKDLRPVAPPTPAKSCRRLQQPPELIQFAVDEIGRIALALPLYARRASARLPTPPSEFA